MDNYLQHWGVKGMKWGVRRYQNKDGTLTAAGKKRYQKKFEKEVKKNWMKTYSRSSDEFNRKLDNINEKYKDDDFREGYSTKRGRQYINEISSSWKNIYAKNLREDFGDSPVYGKKWVETAPLMDMYAEYLE